MKKRKSNRKKLQEYSKRVLAMMVALWFITAVFGAAVIVYQVLNTSYEYGSYVSLDGLFNFVGLPVGGGIVSYLIKSAVENKQKIKNGTQSECGDICMESEENI